MGRGLSDLQQQLLVLAWRNRQDLNRQAEVYQSDTLTYRRNGQPARRMVTVRGHVDLYYAEALCTIWGWHSQADWPIWVTPSARQFSKRRIGARRYTTARVILTRACERLEARGLVQRRGGAYVNWNGIQLTTFGAQLAEHLMANTISP
jgi:hypothetical protein